MKLGTILSAHAFRAPDHLAVACGDERMSYRELEETTNRLARALLANGLKTADRVVVILDNSQAVVVALVAIVKAGGIVVPVSTRLTSAEIGFILSDSRPFAAVYQPYHRELVTNAMRGLPQALRIAGKAPVMGELSMDAMSSEGDAGAMPPLPVAFDDCMICYTSGTTGKPKGAIATHANLIATHGLINARDWGLTGNDRFLIVTPLAHRTGIGRMVNALCVGGSIFVLQKFDSTECIATIERERITVMGMVPTVARLLLPEIENAPQRVSSLRVAVVTGEAFPVEAKKRLLTAIPHLNVFSFFASTEAGAVTSLDTAEQFTHPESVGRPIPGIEVRLVDENDEDVPIGGLGEIIVRAGEPGRYTIMRGYYNRPEENARVLRDGWLYTGDVGRFDAEGYLYIVDRKKDMIISGGLNIYSKEVELAIRQCPGVIDVAVVGVPDPIYGESVAAFIEADSATPVSEADVVGYCRKAIAGYKKPKYVRIVNTLPRNSLGKVLKYVLRDELAKVAGASPAS